MCIRDRARKTQYSTCRRKYTEQYHNIPLLGGAAFNVTAYNKMNTCNGMLRNNLRIPAEIPTS